MRALCGEIRQTEEKQYYMISPIRYHYISVRKKKRNSEKQRLEWWVPGAERRGNEEMSVKGYKFPVIRRM